MKAGWLMPDCTLQSNDISMIFTLRNQEKTGGFDDNIIELFQGWSWRCNQARIQGLSGRLTPWTVKITPKTVSVT